MSKEIFNYTHSMLEEDVQRIYNMIKFDRFVPDYIVGLSRGGVIPAVCLSHKLKVPMIPLEWGKSTQRVNQTLAELVECRKYNFLVVDDICDTGKSITDLFNHWDEWALFNDNHISCNSFRIASLVNYCEHNVFYSNLSGSVLCNYGARTVNNKPWVEFYWEAM